MLDEKENWKRKRSEKLKAPERVDVRNPRRSRLDIVYETIVGYIVLGWRSPIVSLIFPSIWRSANPHSFDTHLFANPTLNNLCNKNKKIFNLPWSRLCFLKFSRISQVAAVAGRSRGERNRYRESSSVFGPTYGVPEPGRKWYVGTLDYRFACNKEIGAQRGASLSGFLAKAFGED